MVKKIYTLLEKKLKKGVIICPLRHWFAVLTGGGGAESGWARVLSPAHTPLKRCIEMYI